MEEACFTLGWPVVRLSPGKNYLTILTAQDDHEGAGLTPAQAITINGADSLRRLTGQLLAAGYGPTVLTPEEAGAVHECIDWAHEKYGDPLHPLITASIKLAEAAKAAT